MSIEKHYVRVGKTARYFTHNSLWDETSVILIVLHGYAETAEHIIESFKSLDKKYYVIAPEGLNRFYSKGFGGTPVASWMTSLERDAEISDYVRYLDALYEHLMLDAFDNAKIVVLGFSQGVATASRWVQATPNKIDGLVMIAEEIAREYQGELPAKLKAIPKAFFIGDTDSLIREEKVQMMRNLLGENTLFEKFSGNHEINDDCLKLVIKMLDGLK